MNNFVLLYISQPGLLLGWDCITGTDQWILSQSDRCYSGAQVVRADVLSSFLSPLPWQLSHVF